MQAGVQFFVVAECGGMCRISIAFVTLGFFAAVGCSESSAEKEKERKPKFTVSKETTYVTGPLDKDGYIDYETALNERLGQGVTPANNAVVLLWKALGPHPEGATMPPEFFKTLRIEAPPESGEYFSHLFGYMKEHLKLEAGEQTEAIYDQQRRATQRPWTAKQYPHIAAWLKVNEKPVALAIEATKRSHYFYPLVSHKTEKGPGGLMGALLPGVQICREVANGLVARAMLHVGEGRFDNAWRDLLACHRLARLIGRGGTLIEALIGMAIDQVASDADLAFLAHANLTAPQIQACLRDLQQLPALPAVADKIDLGERFMFLDIVMMTNRQGFQYFEGLTGGPPPEDPDPRVKQLLDDLNWDTAMRNGNRWYDRFVAVMRVKDRDSRHKQLGKIDAELRMLKKSFEDPREPLGRVSVSAEARNKAIGDILICLMLPSISKVQNAADRGEQVQRNLHLAFALAAYQRDHGRYPMKLEALTPKYLPHIPDDLFSGKALVYRPSGNGYLLYSVGLNGRDDDGRSPDDEPPGDDPRVRMPLPKLPR
jgi:hypothetical protein